MTRSTYRNNVNDDRMDTHKYYANDKNSSEKKIEKIGKNMP